MKLTSQKRSITLPVDNLVYAEKVCKQGKLAPEAIAVYLLIAEMLDEIAGGEDLYMTIGSVRDRSAFVLTVTKNGDKTPIYGDHLADLNTKALALLGPQEPF